MEKLFIKQSSNPDFYLIDLPRSKYVFLDIIAPAGSVFENPSQDGIAHLLEHYIVRTANSKQNKIKIDGLMSKEYIHLWTKFNKKLLKKPEQIFKLIDSIFRLDFKKDIFIKEKKKLIREINFFTDDLDYQINEFCLRERFGVKCPYSGSSLGNKDAIVKISLKELKKFYNSYFFSKNTMVIVGLDQEKYKNEATAILNHIKQYKLNTMNRSFPCGGYSNFKLRIKEHPLLKSNYLVFSFPGPALKNYFIDRVVLKIFCEILLNNLKSICKYNFNYRIIETWRSFGMVIFKLRTRRNKKESIIKIIKEFFKLAESEKIKFWQFNKIIKNIKQEEKRIAASLDLRYECILDSIISNSVPFFLKNKEFKKITPADVASTGKQYINKKYLNLFILGKEFKDVDIEEIKEVIRKGSE